jgi:hypothetical protein
MGMSEEGKGYLWAIIILVILALVIGAILYASGASSVADSWCKSLDFDGGTWTYIEKTICKTTEIEKLYLQGG